jgi:excisionase family DNA binding protein
MTGLASLLTRKEAAEYLGVSVPSMDRWASQGVGPAYYKLGRLTRYRRNDLEAFMETRRQQKSCDD